MKKKIAKRWIAALRSGEYIQGRGQLRNQDKFCCLGILCNLHAQDHPQIAASQLSPTFYLGKKADLAHEVVRWADISVSSESVLMDMNDAKQWSFNQIADHIKENWRTM